jgi:hypothetical protein
MSAPKPPPPEVVVVRSCRTVKYNLARLINTVNGAQLIQINVAPADQGEVYVVPQLLAHLAGKRQEHGSTLQASSSEEHVLVGTLRPAGAVYGLERGEELGESEGAVVERRRWGGSGGRRRPRWWLARPLRFAARL